MKKFRVALLPSHPKQVWMLHSFEKHFQQVNTDVEFCWIIRDKDISCDLADLLGIQYEKISSASSGLLSNAFELFLNTFRALYITRSKNIDCWITKYGAGNIAAFIARKKSISFNDDDVDVVPLIAITSYTFAEKILVPFCTQMGKYEKKTNRYNSVQETMYLHPKRFLLHTDIWGKLNIKQQQKFAIIRTVSLKAHHDISAQGISETFLEKIINTLEKHNIQPFITSEKNLSPRLRKYLLDIPFNLIHTALAKSTICIGDSLSMSTEAAILGTHSIRISSFSGKVSTLNWLEENKFVYGFKPNQEAEVLQTLTELLHQDTQAKQLHDCVETSEDPMTQWSNTLNNSLNS